jgi:hypothetical protein
MNTRELVLPRDAFNDGNLLTNIGRFVLLCDVLNECDKLSYAYKGSQFDIVQWESDGSTSVANFNIIVNGEAIPHFRPLNSRETFSLYVVMEDEQISVFDKDGNFSKDFKCNVL